MAADDPCEFKLGIFERVFSSGADVQCQQMSDGYISVGKPAWGWKAGGSCAALPTPPTEATSAEVPRKLQHCVTAALWQALFHDLEAEYAKIESTVAGERSTACCCCIHLYDSACGCLFPCGRGIERALEDVAKLVVARHRDAFAEAGVSLSCDGANEGRRLKKLAQEKNLKRTTSVLRAPMEPCLWIRLLASKPNPSLSDVQPLPEFRFGIFDRIFTGADKQIEWNIEDYVSVGKPAWGWKKTSSFSSLDLPSPPDEAKKEEVPAALAHCLTLELWQALFGDLVSAYAKHESTVKGEASCCCIHFYDSVFGCCCPCGADLEEGIADVARHVVSKHRGAFEQAGVTLSCPGVNHQRRIKVPAHSKKLRRSASKLRTPVEPCVWVELRGTSPAPWAAPFLATTDVVDHITIVKDQAASWVGSAVANVFGGATAPAQATMGGAVLEGDIQSATPMDPSARLTEGDMVTVIATGRSGRIITDDGSTRFPYKIEGLEKWYREDEVTFLKPVPQEGAGVASLDTGKETAAFGDDQAPLQCVGRLLEREDGANSYCCC